MINVPVIMIILVILANFLLVFIKRFTNTLFVLQISGLLYLVSGSLGLIKAIYTDTLSFHIPEIGLFLLTGVVLQFLGSRFAEKKQAPVELKPIELKAKEEITDPMGVWAELQLIARAEQQMRKDMIDPN